MYVLYLAFAASSLLLTECAPSMIDFSQPVTATVYQGAIGQGFSTNYFKTEVPAKKYREQNIQDVYDIGFRNLRLRCRADFDKYIPIYDNSEFDIFLDELENVVDKCIEVGVAPIISWIHHVDEADATEEARQNYVSWWTRVADRLKDKSYLLSFNLFTELGVDYCKANLPTCDNSLRRNLEKYNEWSEDAIDAIRTSGGNNEKRIIILAAPEKTSQNLLTNTINEELYAGDNYMMFEWHEYAAGPNKVLTSRRYWVGNGTEPQREILINGLEEANQFSINSGLPSYFGAWMPRDNKLGELTQEEVINFARFYVYELKKRGVPWSLNVLDDYYDTKKSLWRTGPQEYKGDILLEPDVILENIVDVLENF